MKNICLNIVVTFCAVLPLTSCNDWLGGVTQTATVSNEIVWQDAKYADKSVNTFYTILHRYGQFGETQFGGNLTESPTDVFKYGLASLGHRTGHPNVYVIDLSVVTPDGYLYNIWSESTAYGSIRQINQFLAMQKQYPEFPEEQNARWEVQARLFRVCLYFQLAKRHGSVIIYEGLPESSDKALSPAEETWKLVVDDSDFTAANLLKEWVDPSAKGRVTQGAAYVLKSRTILYAEQWQAAYDAADRVEKFGLYDSASNYADAWSGNNNGYTLAFRYNKNSEPHHSFSQCYVPQCDGYDFGATDTPTQEMVERYEIRDGKVADWTSWHEATNQKSPYDQPEPRFAVTIIHAGSEWKGRKMDYSVGGKNGEFMTYREQVYSSDKTTTGYFFRKLLDEKLTDIRGQRSSQPWVEIRFAEVLSNKAEVAFRLGKTNEAQTPMNRVRTHVGLSPRTSTGDAWLKDYHNERKVELVYEGHLSWDTCRWKLAHIEYNNYRCRGTKIIDGTYEYVDCDDQDRKFSSKFYRLSVLTSELKNNKSAKQSDE